VSRLFVKICGLTTPQDALAAAEAGADAVGLVFWAGSPRAVTVEEARAISDALPPFVLRVGVFVDASPDEMARAADAARLDLLQLHGEEPPEALSALPRRALKAVRVGERFSPWDALRYEGLAAGLLLDTRASGSAGGTGRAFDWSLARAVRERSRFLLLAGGLSPENVAAAIGAVRPDGVDASSRLEAAPRRKDHQRVRAFVTAVRAAEREGTVAGTPPGVAEDGGGGPEP
jgi:phosphoribosylanthranilate isomerase